MQQQFHLMKPTSILGFVPLLNIHATPNLYASSSNINIKEQVLIPKGFETLNAKTLWHEMFLFHKDFFVVFDEALKYYGIKIGIKV